MSTSSYFFDLDAYMYQLSEFAALKIPHKIKELDLHGSDPTKLFYPLKPFEKAPFRLDAVDALTVERFIELLAPLALHYFSAASRSCYIQCLDLRGLEYGQTELAKYDEDIPAVQNVHRFYFITPRSQECPGGNTINQFYGKKSFGIHFYPERYKCLRYLKFAKFLIPVVSLAVCGYNNIPLAVRRYKHLKFQFRTDKFKDQYPDALRLYLHPKVECVVVVIFERSNIMLLDDIIGFLNMCNHVKKFDFRLPEFTYIREASGYIGMNQVARKLQAWASQRDEAVDYFCFQYKELVYLFEDGIFCFLQYSLASFRFTLHSKYHDYDHWGYFFQPKLNEGAVKRWQHYVSSNDMDFEYEKRLNFIVALILCYHLFALTSNLFSKIFTK